MQRNRIGLLIMSLLMTVDIIRSSEAEFPDIIPKPVQCILQEGVFVLDVGTQVLYRKNTPELERMAFMFAEEIEKTTGYALSVSSARKKTKSIRLEINGSAGIHEEGYQLSINPEEIKITAGKPAGVFYALQTLRQIILTRDGVDGYSIPSMEITDYPRFSWRGMHLDVCRHFVTVDSVKRFIDHLALYKLNRFHWHLTEDQGWRIEIRRYPRLTEVGAWRKETIIGRSRDVPKVFDGKPHGGFYTQEEIREVVQYATDRFITVIPEIEMPGHAQAAIAAYPELGVTGQPVEVWTEWGVSPWIFSPFDNSFDFLEDVLEEVMELFPSEYIHIGGDEAIKDQWKASSEVQALMAELGLKTEEELQSWFIKRVEKFLNSRGRKLIGWDEILQGGLAPNATVMAWHNVRKGMEAAKLGNDVVMTPNSHLYFSYYQADSRTEPLASRAGTTLIEKVYSYDPVPAELDSSFHRHILGAQACLWTEYMKTFRHMEYMTFPRITALSEVVWSPAATKDYPEFSARVRAQVKMWEKLNIHYSKTGMPR